MDYNEFIESKKHTSFNFGFNPVFMPNMAFDFQKEIIRKAIKKGRIGIFLDTGLGKTLIQLTIAENIVRHTNGKVLILTPLAVGYQFLLESKKIGVNDISISRDGEVNTSIIVCNYEKLHLLNPKDFQGILLDESSILKNFKGKIKKQITAFAKKIKYRFLASATPAPNDYIEFGTSSEVLGYMGYMDMISRFFANNQNTADSNNKNVGNKFYLKPHAEKDFFSWIKTWSIHVKKPSDLGYSDENYILPNLNINEHIIDAEILQSYNCQLSFVPITARSFFEIRNEANQTIKQRCEKAYKLAKDKVSVYWVNLNKESEYLAKLDKEAVEIKGSLSLEKKEQILKDFQDGKIKRIITKAKITGVGLNWQHCNHSVFFPTFSYEQYYQAIRRFWRFGQKNEVNIDIVISRGQSRILKVLKEKSQKAQEFQNNIKQNLNTYTKKTIKTYKKEFPKWISK